MAGLGKKTFTAGEVLTAADVNGYLMEQSVMVFGGTAARSSAVPTPSEGMVTYLSDLNDIQAYDGSNWISTGLTAGTTTANYGWPIPASGSIASLGTAIDTTIAGLPTTYNKIASGTFSAQSTLNISSLLTDTYQNYQLFFWAYASTTAGILFRFRENTTDVTTAYYGSGFYVNTSGATGSYAPKANAANLQPMEAKNSSGEPSFFNATILRRDNTQGSITWQAYDTTQGYAMFGAGNRTGMTNFNGLTIYTSTGNMTGGYVLTGIKQ